MRLTTHTNCNHRFKVLGAMVAFITIFACTKEKAENLESDNHRIGFAVTTNDNNWSQIKSSVCPIEGYSGTDTLFLHMTEEVIPNVCTPDTKGSHITEDNFYPSFGVFAYSFQGDWKNTVTPNWMYNE